MEANCKSKKYSNHKHGSRDNNTLLFKRLYFWKNVLSVSCYSYQYCLKKLVKYKERNEERETKLKKDKNIRQTKTIFLYFYKELLR